MKFLMILLTLFFISPVFAVSDEEYFLNRKDTKSVSIPRVTHIDAFTQKGCDFLEIEIDNSGVYDILHNPNCRNHFQSEERRRLNSSRHSYYHN